MLEEEVRGEALAYITALVTGAVSVWSMFWMIRRGYGADDPLTRKEKLIRWSVVAAGFCIALFVEGDDPEFKLIRIGGWLLATAFLAWPNFAHMLGRPAANKK